MNFRKFLSIVLVVIISVFISSCQNGSEVTVETGKEAPENTYTADQIISLIYKNSLDPAEEEVFPEPGEEIFGGKTDPIYLRRASDCLVGEHINIAPFESKKTDVVFAYYPKETGGKVILLIGELTSKAIMLVCKTDLSATAFAKKVSAGNNFSAMTVEKVDIIDINDYVFPANSVWGTYYERTDNGESAYDYDLYPITDDTPFFGAVHPKDYSLNEEICITITLEIDTSFQDVYDRFGVQIYE